MFHENDSEPPWDKNIQKYTSKFEVTEPKCEMMFSVTYLCLRERSFTEKLNFLLGKYTFRKCREVTL